VYASLPSPFRLGDRKQTKLEGLGYVMQYGSVLLERLQVRLFTAIFAPDPMSVCER
jgi:hypothetical protein